MSCGSCGQDQPPDASYRICASCRARGFDPKRDPNWQHPAGDGFTITGFIAGLFQRFWPTTSRGDGQ